MQYKMQHKIEYKLNIYEFRLHCVRLLHPSKWELTIGAVEKEFNQSTDQKHSYKSISQFHKSILTNLSKYDFLNLANSFYEEVANLGSNLIWRFDIKANAVPSHPS